MLARAQKCIVLSAMVPVLWSQSYDPIAMVQALWSQCSGLSTMVPVLWSHCYGPGTMVPVLWSQHYSPSTMVPLLWSQCYGPSTMVPALICILNMIGYSPHPIRNAKSGTERTMSHYHKSAKGSTPPHPKMLWPPLSNQ